MDTAYIGTQKFLVSERCEFLQVSDEFLRLFEYTSDELWERFSNSLFAMLYPDDVDRVKREMDRQLSDGTFFAVNHRVLKRSGQIVWLHNQGRIAEEDGVRYLYAELSDVSRYYTQDSYYEGILNAIPTPVVVTDDHLHISFLNTAAEKDIGITLAQCRGKTCSIFAIDHCGTEDCCVKRFERGEPFTVARTGNGRVNRVQPSPLYGAGGEKIGYVILLTDVTESPTP